jgi:hypothetical protein
MKAKDIEALVGIPYAELSRCKGFEVVAYLGDHVESLGARDTIEDALLLLREHVIPEDADDAWLDGHENETSVEDPEFRPMAIALSGACLMERRTDRNDLVYLGDVLEDRPKLRLVVAWEAVPHLHDVAFGLFTTPSS